MDAEAVDRNRIKDIESVKGKEKGKPQPLHFSVTEKIIFCIDAMVFSNHANDSNAFEVIFDMLLLYMKMKKKISTKPAEFQCLICSQGNVSLFNVNEGRDLQNAIMSVNGKGEKEGFDLSDVFGALARSLELPHPQLCNEMEPPPWVHHCLMLFGHNIYPPVMKESNTFDFLVQNPFFSFDTVYLYNNSLPDNNCEIIGNVLYSLYEVINGYFFAVRYDNIDKQYGVFAQLLGHPLIRPRQNKAKFNLNELVLVENA